MCTLFSRKESCSLDRLTFLPKVTALVGTLSILSEMQVKLAQAKEGNVWCQVIEGPGWASGKSRG